MAGKPVTKIYVDGEDATGIIATDNLSGSIQNDVPLCIGTRQSGVVHNFNGAIHGAAIWNTALTPDEIRYIYVKDAPYAPRVQLSAPRLAPPSGFSFSWNSLLGRTYTVESSADLAAWTPVVTSYPSGGAQTTLTSYTNTSVGSGKLFYRVRSE